jgi:hypothetical protein
MSSKVITYIFILLVFNRFVALGQVEDGKTFSCGNNVAFMPTASTFPYSNFKVQTGRLNFISKPISGLSNFELTAGLSSNTEFYLKLLLEASGSLSKYSSFGYGGKLILPFNVPFVRRMALWSESVSTPLEDSMSFLPQNVLRGGLAANFDILNLESTLLVGITKSNKTVRPLTGIGIMMPASNLLKLGSEVIYNYFGRKEIQGIATGNVRVISNMSIQISAGYLSSRKISSWLYSINVSFTTADIDFFPKNETQQQDIVPSFEEIEKQSSEDKNAQEEKK